LKFSKILVAIICIGQRVAETKTRIIIKEQDNAKVKIAGCVDITCRFLGNDLAFENK
jgi:hypothetical protein